MVADRARPEHSQGHRQCHRRRAGPRRIQTREEALPRRFRPDRKCSPGFARKMRASGREFPDHRLLHVGCVVPPTITSPARNVKLSMRAGVFDLIQSPELAEREGFEPSEPLRVH